jgi:Peptidase A4 family/PASTA domain
MATIPTGPSKTVGTANSTSVDEDQLTALIRVPYKLVPTNLAGAFITPAPPADFDPNTESPDALIKHGFLWRRPGKEDDPILRAAWERVFSRRWRAEDRLVPELAPQVGKTHNLRNAKRLADGTIPNDNWAGSAVPGTWTGAIGFWAVPTVTEPLEPQSTGGGWDSSSWVGIDGWGSNDVLQAGVQQTVDANGNAHYVAWFEWFAPPQSDSPPYIFQTNITNFVVVPGQTVYCSVQYISNGTAGQVSFANESTGQHFSITLAPPPGATFSGSSAEWIMEAPNGGEPTTSLPMFTPVVFTSAICCGPNGTLDNPSDGDIFNIVVPTTLTSVSVGPDTVTIDYVGPKVTVPDIIGLSAEHGDIALTEVGLVGIEKVIPGDINSNILSQTPAAGTMVPVHSEVNFEIKARPVIIQK